jgi:hypothetical protein
MVGWLMNDEEDKEESATATLHNAAQRWGCNLRGMARTAILLFAPIDQQHHQSTPSPSIKQRDSER